MLLEVLGKKLPAQAYTHYKSYKYKLFEQLKHSFAEGPEQL